MASKPSARKRVYDGARAITAIETGVEHVIRHATPMTHSRRAVRAGIQCCFFPSRSTETSTQKGGSTWSYSVPSPANLPRVQSPGVLTVRSSTKFYTSLRRHAQAACSVLPRDRLVGVFSSRASALKEPWVRGVPAVRRLGADPNSIFMSLELRNARSAGRTLRAESKFRLRHYLGLSCRYMLFDES